MAKGLGKGMGALFGEETMREEPASQRKLPVAKIEPRRGQPRENFDPEKLQELAESLQRHGMIQPITVRPMENGYYQIIAGERRWRAARLAVDGGAGIHTGGRRADNGGACADRKSPTGGLESHGGGQRL